MKQTSLKEVSPLLQRIINWSSIIGALGTLSFCIWAYFAGILQSKETLSAFILQAGIFGPPLFIFLQFVQSMVSQKTYDKYIGWLNEGKRFDRFFIFMMIWPVSPADFICMLAGLTKMTFKRYMTIIILCKPITLVIYTYGLTYIIDYFWKMV